VEGRLDLAMETQPGVSGKTEYIYDEMVVPVRLLETDGPNPQAPAYRTLPTTAWVTAQHRDGVLV
jgi:hypothetical protein